MLSVLRFVACVVIAIAIALIQASTLGVVISDGGQHLAFNVAVFAIAPSLVTGALLYFASATWRGKLWAFGVSFAVFALVAKLSYQSDLEIERLVHSSGAVGNRADLVRASLESTAMLGLVSGGIALFFGAGALLVYLLKQRADNRAEKP